MFAIWSTHHYNADQWFLSILASWPLNIFHQYCGPKTNTVKKEKVFIRIPTKHLKNLNVILPLHDLWKRSHKALMLNPQYSLVVLKKISSLSKRNAFSPTDWRLMQYYLWCIPNVYKCSAFYILRYTGVGMVILKVHVACMTRTLRRKKIIKNVYI